MGAHDELAVGQAGVALGLAGYEAASGIDENMKLLLRTGSGPTRLVMWRRTASTSSSRPMPSSCWVDSTTL